MKTRCLRASGLQSAGSTPSSGRAWRCSSEPQRHRRDTRTIKHDTRTIKHDTSEPQRDCWLRSTALGGMGTPESAPRPSNSASPPRIRPSDVHLHPAGTSTTGSHHISRIFPRARRQRQAKVQGVTRGGFGPCTSGGATRRVRMVGGGGVS